MNYLAHLYLADDTPESLIGNLCADFLAGTRADSFSPGIQRGIAVHRAVDMFTDSHATVRRSVSRLFPAVRHFAPIAVDVCYDHFLSRNWSRYATVPLESFVERAFRVLGAHVTLCPPQFQAKFPRMRDEQWLLCYNDLPGVAEALERISERLTRPQDIPHLMAAVEREYAGLEADFLEFFPQLCAFVAERKAA